jgi:hypothetical protein
LLLAAWLANLRNPLLFRKNPGEGDECAQNHRHLKADRANGPFQNVRLHVGHIGFEIGLKRRKGRAFTP